MASSKKIHDTRSRQHVAVFDEEEDSEHSPSAYNLNTPTPERQVEDVVEEEQESLRDQLRETPGKERFQVMVDEYKKMQLRLQGMKEQNALLLSERAEAEKMISELTVERDEAIAHRDLAERKRGQMAIQLLEVSQSGTRGDTPIVGVTATAGAMPVKSAKLPDAPILKDGKEVRYETWESIIRQKLRANADYFPTPDHRKFYIQSRCEGKAHMHIAPRLNDKASEPYIDAEDMLDHLRSVFENPNRVAEAFTEYSKLKMKPKDNFNDFLSEFIQLAEEAQVPMGSRKRDLLSKLPYLLRNHLIGKVHEPHVTFDVLTKLCQSISHEITEIQDSNPRSRSTFTSGSTSTNTGGTTPRVKREGSVVSVTLSKSDELPPKRPGVDHEIILKAEAQPGYCPLYKLSFEELKAAKSYILENLEKGFIMPSSALYASPILMVKKANGGLRFCVDYRRLNAITKKDCYPLLLIDEVLQRTRVLGAVLTQYYEEDDFWHPAAYYSKTMQPIELNYEIHDKELLVIVRAL
ncbi:hypothetical protein PENCOP_c021G03699 [Penicillium coprophilum]|uniref:Reverse transcriptase/retrotransposon-derived protein RNase H-like domain-containing protein n=1 Tax=Penicillium coprophilum TaxID=36646 RepID=A0A1V6U7A6_9EURO|nr:hypothetical protein PENCOP_c021G03699 [Penicillium coprophilum]